MKVLILGGCGYIGTRLIDFLRKSQQRKDMTIVSVDSNNYSGGKKIKEYKDIQYITAKFQELPESFYSEFTDVILLAGQGSVSNSKNVLNVIDNNVRNFAWLLDVLTSEQKLIYASSSSVYGRTNNKEVDEEFSKTSGYEPYNYYDWSKQTIDQLAELSGKHYYSLRFGTVNGFSRNLRNDVMINSMTFNAKKNGKIFVSNHGVNRPILGVDDLCKAIFTIIQHGKKELSGVYNLNSFNATVGEIASTVSTLCGVPCENINNNTAPIINFKLQTKSYDFKIHSTKFIKNFKFEFKDTLESITSQLLTKWNSIEHFQNRLDDNFVSYKMVKNCRVCDNPTYSLLDLGYQPLANNYTKYHEALDYNPCHINAEEKYPLYLHVCHNCFHTQLNCVVRPEKLFQNYLYVSGTSQTLNKFFQEFALSTIFMYYLKQAENRGETDIWNSLPENSNLHLKVLDIACNDGSQLDAFVNCVKTFDSHVQITTVGVDPAENIYKDISSKKTEHDIYCEFFSQNTVDKLKEKYGHFDIIIAQNVFAHIDYPKEFLSYVSQLMNNDTTLYIQTSQKNMFLENQFDTVYHEHLSFFNANSMKILCDLNHLMLTNVHEHDIHGTSYVFEISKTPSSVSNTQEVLHEEEENGLYNVDTYTRYKLKCLKYRNDVNNKIMQAKLDNKNIIAFGSTAKSMTLFNFCGLTHDFIDVMIDENHLKQGLFTPGSNILVTSIDELRYINENTVILITAWNFYKEIKDKIMKKLKEYKIDYPVTLLNIDSLEEEVVNA